jgi:hypothetical protein
VGWDREQFGRYRPCVTVSPENTNSVKPHRTYDFTTGLTRLKKAISQRHVGLGLDL